MKKPSRDWKDVYRAGIYACPQLRARKIHRDLLAYLVYRANQKVRLCWPSQPELAQVLGCSVRNVHDLVSSLENLGAIFAVPFVDLPTAEKALIKELTPSKVTRNAKVYYLCEEWAFDVLGNTATSEGESTTSTINISPADRQKGRERANDRRRRYVPASLEIGPYRPSNPLHDDWQFINAIVVETGSPASPLKLAETGSPTTDRTTEYNPAGNSSANNGHTVGASDTTSFQENLSQDESSSLSLPPMEHRPSATGGGEPVTSRSKPAGFGLPEGARLEGTELGVAGARANERRAL